MKLLNLGCGNRFSPEWTNIDFVSNNPHVIAHDLKKGIPFSSEYFDAVYHSHVLEHFPKEDAAGFITECRRVLKNGGIIRVAVPDLEKLVLCYLEELKSALKGNKTSIANYDWIMIEMFDQMVRKKSGGLHSKYIQQDTLVNEDFIYSRIGDEAVLGRELYLKNKADGQAGNSKKIFSLIKKLFSFSSYKHLFAIIIKNIFPKFYQYHTLGKFQLSGELHQWMYDRYSLVKLLSDSGFENINIKTAFESDIPDWNSFGIETKDGKVLKPDSIFVEAIKQK